MPLVRARRAGIRWRSRDGFRSARPPWRQAEREARRDAPNRRAAAPSSGSSGLRVCQSQTARGTMPGLARCRRLHMPLLGATNKAPGAPETAARRPGMLGPACWGRETPPGGPGLGLGMCHTHPPQPVAAEACRWRGTDRHGHARPRNLGLFDSDAAPRLLKAGAPCSPGGGDGEARDGSLRPCVPSSRLVSEWVVDGALAMSGDCLQPERVT